jgi:hypothetical protein
MPLLPPSRRLFRTTLRIRWSPALRGAAAALLFLGCRGAGIPELRAQDARSAGDGWNAPRALELLELGRAARQGLVDDGTLTSYQALTEGHVYFYVDPEEGERALIRVDQVAVELYWEAPDLVRQRIVGERSETRLPVRDFRYYLDRLTLVQYGFGDEIEVGQGMDVSGVPHPLSPAPRGWPADDPRSLEPYEFRLADSVALRLPGEPDPLTIYELQVRPRDPTRPGILGSIFLNAADGQLVRMAFTFTPASYVDRRTDRIHVELDYGLWEGRYWLPNRQDIEVRREMPELDFEVGTVIRAVLRVSGYELNAPLPEFVRFSWPVTQAPEEERRGYAFREGLFDAIDRDGLAGVATRVDPRALRAEAARLMRNRPPTGLSPVRLHLPDASSLVRADRARGVTVGAGTSIRPAGALRVRGWAGWSFGTGRPAASLGLDGLVAGAWSFRAEGAWNDRGDLGARSAAPGLFSTAGALFGGEDYLDPFAISRLRGSAGTRTSGGYRLELQGGVERHRTEPLAWTESPGSGRRAFRPVREVTEGTFGAAGISLSRRIEGLGWGGWGGASGAVATLRGSAEFLAGSAGTGGRVEAGASLLRRPPDARHELRLEFLAGSRLGDPLGQHLRFLGGRGTVAGFPVRGHGGAHWALAGIEGARDLAAPWLRLRGGIDAGWTDGAGAGILPGTLAEGGVLVGVRGGVGLFFDILRIEGARGLTGAGAEWQLLLSVDPLWWDRL